MRILFVTGEYPPMQGGVGSYTQELCRAVCEVEPGSELAVLTSTAAARPDNEGVSDNIRVLPAVRAWNWGTASLVARLAADLRADWIHVQYQTAAFGMHPAINLAPRSWRRRGLRVAWTYHDLLVPYLFPKAGARLRTYFTERPAHHAEITIVTNEADRLQLAARGLAAENIPIGSNIGGVELAPAERRQRRRLLGYEDDDLVLAYFGFLNRSKGGIPLVRALARLRQEIPRIQLRMIGEKVGASDATNFAYLQEVEALILALGLAEHVQWTGRQPDAEVAADLNACDVLVMPYEDGASLRRGTLMAGLANGCAIVTTTPQGPLPELQDGRDLLYAPPGDAAALAAAVLRIAADPELAALLRRNARERSALFSWAAIARRHLELYRRPPRPK